MRFFRLPSCNRTRAILAMYRRVSGVNHTEAHIPALTSHVVERCPSSPKSPSSYCSIFTMSKRRSPRQNSPRPGIGELKQTSKDSARRSSMAAWIISRADSLSVPKPLYLRIASSVIGTGVSIGNLGLSPTEGSHICPRTMLIPQVVGFKLIGQLPEGATATDLVLTVTQMLRKKGVVGKFVEFFGPGLR